MLKYKYKQDQRVAQVSALRSNSTLHRFQELEELTSTFPI